MVKTFVNIIGLTCMPGYPTCACVGGSLCVCKMYNNSTLVFYFTAVRSTGTYPSLKYETSSVGCGCCLQIMLCQLLGQHWSATRARSASPGSRPHRKLPHRFTALYHLSPPLHLQMRQRAPDNHV